MGLVSLFLTCVRACVQMGIFYFFPLRRGRIHFFDEKGGAWGIYTFELVLADVDEARGAHHVGGKVVDHFGTGMCF